MYDFEKGFRLGEWARMKSRGDLLWKEVYLAAFKRSGNRQNAEECSHKAYEAYSKRFAVTPITPATVERDLWCESLLCAYIRLNSLIGMAINTANDTADAFLERPVPELGEERSASEESEHAE